MQFVEYFVVSDISCVQNILGVLEGHAYLRTKKAVRVGNDANDDATMPWHDAFIVPAQNKDLLGKNRLVTSVRSTAQIGKCSKMKLDLRTFFPVGEVRLRYKNDLRL